MNTIRKIHKAVWLCLLLAAVSGVVLAQDTRGLITGRILDPSGATMPGATITLTNMATNVALSTKSNEAGKYEILYVLPGTYRLTAELAGFKRLVRDDIEMRIADRLQIDIGLEIGEVSQNLTVTAETPLLEASTASMGQVVDQKRIADLPVAHGNPYLLIGLSAGVSHTQSIDLTQPYAPTHIVGYAIDGVRANRSEITLDGSPNTAVNHLWGRGDLMAGYTPPADVVQEMKVVTSAFDASVGHTQGGITSVTLKSGTNSLHGTAYYALQNPVLDANYFFANRDGQPKAPYHYRRDGGSLTGPVWIPKVYDGRNRTFFTFGYEAIFNSTPRGQFLTVPTEAQRNGDFSELLKLGPAYQIYDPVTRTAAGGGLFQVQPFPNNIIPADRISPIAKNVLKFISLPNTAGSPDGGNNLNRTGEQERLDYTNYIVRFDHNLGPNHRMFGRYNRYNRQSTFNDWFHSAASGGVVDWPQNAFTLDDVYTLSPATVLNVRYSVYRLSIGIKPSDASRGFDLTTLGLPASLNDATGAAERAFPFFNIQGYFSTWDGHFEHNHQNHTLEGNLTSLRGNHTLKIGADARQYGTFHVEPGNSTSGNFQFDSSWTNGPFNTSPAAPRGQGLASFLLGLPTGGRVDRNATYAEQSTEYSVFFHDDWRITPRLTLNLGVRWEFEGPLTERFNRSVRGYDFQTPNPLEAQAKANYALNPIPELPVSDFRFTGGLTFPGVNGQPRELWNRQMGNIMPRFGFAYSLNPKTVVRGGYGIYYGPLGARRTDVIQTGFSQPTPLIPSLDNGLTFVATLANPFPNGIQDPPGAKDGLRTFAGRNISFFNPNPQAARQQRWQIGIQREMPARVLLDVAYVGNYGDRLETQRDYRPLPLNYLSRSGVRDQGAADYLGAQVPNPFFGLLPGTGLAGQTVSRSYLLRTGDYSGFTGLTARDHDGYTTYHSLQARVERRFSAGWTLNGTYTWSKNMEALNRLNGYLDQLEYVISDQDRPHRLVLSGIWELPFGRGKRFFSRGAAVDKVVGGWQVQGLFTGQGGNPVQWWGDVFFRGNVKDITLPRSQRNVSQWFNVNAGFERNPALQPVAHLRTFPSRLSDVRADGINTMNLSVLKNTSLRENLKLQFRV
ncbi:MAG: carboxypeptidase regulatory-like domain-containing protein, partial [Acidobacteria bacterium]|nr:carboxypeptidase regulatory-like domain-containing protein [Acidobacteriota bacterium]